MQRFAGIAWVVGVVIAVWAMDSRPQEMTFRNASVFHPATALSGVQVVAQQAAPAEPAPETSAPFHYEVKGRRDPFVPLVMEKPEVDGASQPVRVDVDMDRPRGPLERFAISTLQLQGILWGTLGRRAIIRAPDGKGYFVTVGMYMGQNGGQIVSIEDDRLVIKEQFRDTEGNIIDKTLTIPLRRKKTRQG